MKQSADIKFKKPSRSEKEVLISNKISLKSSESTIFDTKVTCFVPKADLQKPMPKIAVTVSVGNQEIRLCADNTADLWEYFAEICAMLEKSSNALELAVSKSRTAYQNKLKEKLNAMDNVIEFNPSKKQA